jgi:hypothetical protein
MSLLGFQATFLLRPVESGLDSGAQKEALGLQAKTSSIIPGMLASWYSYLRTACSGHIIPRERSLQTVLR